MAPINPGPHFPAPRPPPRPSAAKLAAASTPEGHLLTTEALLECERENTKLRDLFAEAKANLAAALGATAFVRETSLSLSERLDQAQASLLNVQRERDAFEKALLLVTEEARTLGEKVELLRSHVGRWQERIASVHDEMDRMGKS